MASLSSDILPGYPVCPRDPGRPQCCPWQISCSRSPRSSRSPPGQWGTVSPRYRRPPPCGAGRPSQQTVPARPPAPGSSSLPPSCSRRDLCPASRDKLHLEWTGKMTGQVRMSPKCWKSILVISVSAYISPTWSDRLPSPARLLPPETPWIWSSWTGQTVPGALSGGRGTDRRGHLQSGSGRTLQTLPPPGNLRRETPATRCLQGDPADIVLWEAINKEKNEWKFPLKIES